MGNIPVNPKICDKPHYETTVAIYLPIQVEVVSQCRPPRRRAPAGSVNWDFERAEEAPSLFRGCSSYFGA